MIRRKQLNYVLNTGPNKQIKTSLVVSFDWVSDQRPSYIIMMYIAHDHDNFFFFCSVHVTTNKSKLFFTVSEDQVKGAYLMSIRYISHDYDKNVIR